MMKMIDVAGIQLDNYTVREAISILSRELSDQGLHTIEEVNTDTLMQAVSDDNVRTALAAMDHTVISEVAILEAAGVVGYQRWREVEHHNFFYELMRMLERNRKKICMVGDTETRTQAMGVKFRTLFPRCELVSLALEQFEGNSDSVVNEINVAAPDVILSILPSPEQENFFLESREKLSANLWYGLGRLDPAAEKNGLFGLIHRRIRSRKLVKQLGSLRQERVGDGED